MAGLLYTLLLLCRVPPGTLSEALALIEIKSAFGLQ